AVISDQLNHASIIDGIRLCKAQRLRYQHNDMNDLETQLKACTKADTKLIATDGVFSMDGTIANLPAICELAEKHGALVMTDDCHATGFLGANGRGTHEFHDCIDRVDIITGTLGKALGGAAGGFVASSKEIVGWLRQRARPYLFSNSIAPMIVAGTLKALELVQDEMLRAKLWGNTNYFRAELEKLGFDLLPGEHPIIPIMLGDAKLATDMANALLEQGVYVIGFSYPVVPEGKARIRTQMSAAHSREQLDQALRTFKSINH
ncbi:MAG: aminotransferase class I/II-fold pyridoxal phosphate-dependent enzyme, partial [Gammaproteobacteria bacterium]|nr:aminotransferase class I/II-fold pyridoxal phosphate-dependent enzyme [Gammaproteobacteria bacterium]